MIRAESASDPTFSPSQMAKTVDSVTFIVPGQPVAKGRPKFARQGGFVRAYTPEKTVAYETLVQLVAGDAMQGAAPMKGALFMHLRIFVAIPKGLTKRDLAGIAMGSYLPVKKPDSDNVLKAISDALNGIAYDDDVQIVDHTISKRYSDTPRAEVTLQRILPTWTGPKPGAPMAHEQDVGVLAA